MTAASSPMAREFPVLKTSADPSSDAFKRNTESHRGMVEDLREKLQKAALGGSASARERHTGRGKLLP
ncbi:MAG TPA: hypothetical protein VMO88_11625, partial [Acidimicrobiales bacterium]|nr:hypothetical protein [Acidimicrobiales bacterium]